MKPRGNPIFTTEGTEEDENTEKTKISRLKRQNAELAFDLLFNPYLFNPNISSFLLGVLIYLGALGGKNQIIPGSRINTPRIKLLR